MVLMTVAFKLAPFIVEGLVTGKFNRVGGVIRDAATGQIVTMLKEASNTGGLPGSVVNPILGVINLMGSMANANLTIQGNAQTHAQLDGIGSQIGKLQKDLALPLIVDPVTGVLNLVMTGINTGVSVKGFSNVNNRLDSVGEQLGFIGQSQQENNGLIRLNTAGSLLNLGVSSIGFAVIAHRLGELDQRLIKAQEMLNKINRKIDLSFYANFRAALDLAANSFRMENAENRRSSALSAINRFLEAEHIYLDFVDQELTQKSPIIDEYLLTLYLAYVAEARCYLELEEFNNALHRFQEGSAKIRSRIQTYIELLLTSNPAVYLHPQFKENISLQRLTNVYRWLDPQADVNSVFELLREKFFELRKDIGQESGYAWALSLPPAIVDRSEVKGGLLGNKAETTQEALRRLPEMFQMMESMIETNNRFEAYQAEIKAISQLGISFHEWMQLKPTEEQPEGANLMFIIPAEPIAV